MLPLLLLFHAQPFPSVAFRPETPVAPLLVRAIEASTGSVHAALYELDQPALTGALQRARARGVDVRVLLDPHALLPAGEDGKPAPVAPALRALLDSGLPVRALSGLPPHGCMHAKFAVLDGSLVAAGSYNWTANSERLHYDDVQFFGAFAPAYELYFDRLWAAATPAAEILRAGPPPPPACPACLAPRRPPAGGLYRGRAPPFLFSPGGGAEAALVGAIRDARESVEVAMFSFYSFKAAGALAGAVRRGLRVRLVLDREQAARSPVTAYLRARGVPLRLLSGPTGPGPHSRMHHKFALFDGRQVAAGSFNWSPNGERRSFETLRFSADPAEAAAFAAQFRRLWEAAENW